MTDSNRPTDWPAFARHASQIADWGAHYHETLGDRPVRAPLTPGATRAQLPASPPETGEPMQAILADLDRIILPGITHWQHPRFFAYFPANAAPASMLAEFAAAILAPQCMLWQTSPAATELEQQMMGWLGQALGLPEGFAGVIQDSASSATLAAVLVMRERALNGAGNRAGLAGQNRLRVYASSEAHSSVERAVRVAGIGAENLVSLPPSGPRRGMDARALAAAIAADRAAGHLPAGVVGCIGATSCGASDDLRAVLGVAREEGLYSHVDAAWAGAAMICPELRGLWDGIELADSLVVNPHKWLGAQFDCSAHFLRDPAALTGTLAMTPEYLKTHGIEGDGGHDAHVDFSEWSVPLGRRFRALKLWFVLRHHGLEGLRAMIRNHIAWSRALHDTLAADARFEIVTVPVLSLFTFRLRGGGDEAQLALLQRVNDDGRIYLTQTRIDGRLALRFQAGSLATRAEDVALAGQVLGEMAL
ncbi:MAG: aspartate aminotransferase family protein [Pararhodobacter sp.]|nr:aspartate aminotransferase family protein [Pararhodobacter sp.]